MMRQPRRTARRVARRPGARRRGATMVETALVIFTLLSLTLGLVQYGLVYNAVLSLNNLSREGARFAAVRAQELGDSTAGRAELKRQVGLYLLQRARGTAIEPRSLATLDLRIDAPEIKSNAPVRVAIRYNMIANKSFVPGLLPLPASYANYEASAVNLIE